MASPVYEVTMNLGGSMPGRNGADGAAGPTGPSGPPGTGPMLGWYNVQSSPYSATGNGTTDDASAIMAAHAAAVAAGGGVVWFPPGTYKYASQLLNTSPKVSWVFSPGVVMAQAFNGVGIKWNFGPFSGTPPVTCGGIYGFPVIDGTNAGSSSVGLEYGDAVDGHNEVVVQNFSGASAIGIWVNTRTNYTEGTWWDATVANCQYGVVFDVQSGAASNSHGYLTIARLRCIGINSGQIGVVVKNNALLYNGEFNILGNLAAGGTFLNIIGAGGSSGMLGRMNLRAEQTTGSAGAATGILISNYGVLEGSGVVDMSSNLLQSSITSGHGTFNFVGKCLAPGLAWNGEVPSFIGGVAWGVHGGTTPTFTNSWVQDGTPVSFSQDATGWVCLEGAVKSGTAATSAFTLPVSYRPPVVRWFAVMVASGTVDVVTINTDGTVVCPNSTRTSLSGIRFQPVQG